MSLLAQPKQRRGRGAAKPPAARAGRRSRLGPADRRQGGRFGPYVTDGETNASLRRTDDVASVTLERATELLVERRAKGLSSAKRKKR